MECIVRDIPVYYESYGTGIPIIMIHGCPVDHRLMKGCMEPILAQQSGWQRIYFDLPGMGRTPGNNNIKTADDMLDVVVDFIDAVIPGQHFLIAGQSYGGYLSQGVVRRMFDQLEGVALICPSIISEHSRRDLPPHTVIVENAELLAELDPTDAEKFASIAVVQDRYTWARFRDEVLPGLRSADMAFVERIPDQDSDSFDVNALPQPFSKPVVLLTGRQDTSTGYRDAWNTLENYPRGTFAVLDRAGHSLQFEQPGLFNALISEWLDRVRESMQ